MPRPRVRVTPRGLLHGELDVVKVELPAVLHAGLLLDRVVVRAEHVRIAPGLPPRLRAGPVSVRVHVNQESVDRWTRTARLPIRVSLTGDGVALGTELAGIRVGEVLTELQVAGRFLRLAPKRMTVVGLPAPLARFLRGYLPLPPLPRGARISDVRTGDGDLAVTLALDQFDEPLDADLLRRVRSLGLPIPGLP